MNGYSPDLISTKVPLDEYQINIFSKYKIRLQISLDSLSNDIAKKMLNVPDGYIDKITYSINTIDKAILATK